MYFNRCEYNSIQLIFDKTFVFIIVLFTLLSSLLVFDITSSVCPDSNLLKPCTCFDDEIYCEVNLDIEANQSIITNINYDG